MKAISRLVLSNLQLSYRVKISFFFNFIFPVLIAFAYFQIFARGNPAAVARVTGPVLTLTVMVNALLLAGMRSAEMRERDMFRQYRLTPLGSFHVVLSDILLGYLTFMPVAIAELLIAVYFYRISVAGSYVAIFVMCSVGYMALSALGLLLSSIVSTVQEANVVTQLLFFVLIFLSGTTMPLGDLPKSLQHAAIFTPPTLMIVPLQGIIVRGEPVAQYVPEILALLLTFLTASIVAILVFRWDKVERVSPRKRIQAAIALVPLLTVGILLNSGSRARSWNPAANDSKVNTPGNQ
jgi:ABC-2 type transport system permease protein